MMTLEGGEWQDGGITAAVAEECFIKSKDADSSETSPQGRCFYSPAISSQDWGFASFDWLHADGQMVRPITRTLLFYKDLPFHTKRSLG